MDKLVEQFEQLKVTAASKDINNDPGIKELIETYSKAVLDCTFFHENFLTENNFRLESTDDDIATSINLLDAIVSLCATVDDYSRRDESLTNFHSLSSSSSHLLNTKTNYGDSYRSVINVLGIEFAECLLWRKGSILYAFCSAKLSSDPCWVRDNKNNLLNKLRDGINYFHTMLSLRKNLVSPKSIDDSMIFSSTDMDLSSSSRTHSNKGESIVFASAKDFKLSKNNINNLLVQKQQIVGALGQELDEMQKSLDEQQIFNEAVQGKIEEELHKNPESRCLLERKLAELNAKQEEVREQQEKNVQKKSQIDNCLRELSQQIQEQQSDSTIRSSESSFDARSANVNTYELIDMGVMSDTHMLAMMYCGDMSFWYCKYSHDWGFVDSSTHEVFNDVRHIGTSYLKIYIKAVDRVLQFNGWTNERAKELLRYFAEYR